MISESVAVTQRQTRNNKQNKHGVKAVQQHNQNIGKEATSAVLIIAESCVSCEDNSTK
jgi:hypothetical protein